MSGAEAERAADADARTAQASRNVRRVMEDMAAFQDTAAALNIDDPILREVKALHQKEGRSMGAVVSELLADGWLAVEHPERARPSTGSHVP
jgi:hypothetical protein